MPKSLSLTDTEYNTIDCELQSFLHKSVMEESSHEEGEFISNIFVHEKRDTGSRVIFNVKTLNKNIEYKHFKMETLSVAVALMTHKCYMASIDLKDAFHPKSHLRRIFFLDLYGFAWLYRDQVC